MFYRVLYKPLELNQKIYNNNIIIIIIIAIIKSKYSVFLFFLLFI